LEEIGPYLLLELRRTQDAPADLMKEALKRATAGPKKQKNVGFDEVDGKVGRIYMPRQELSELSLVKAKGTKRERQDAAIARKKQRLENRTRSAAVSEQNAV
jgi:ribosome production factor 2